MNTRKFQWISILGVALIICGLIGYQAFSTENALAASAKAPVGSWIVTVEIEGLPPFVDVATFHGDGTMSVVENGAAGTGVWEKTSANSYAFTLWTLVDPDLDPTWTRAKIVSTIQLSRDGEQYTGPFVSNLYDQDGNLVVSGEGMATGVRMHVEPMP